MSSRSRAAKAAARAEQSPPRVGADAGGFGGSFGGGFGGMNNGYQGADWSRLRGYVYFPQLDTRVAVSSYTRTEILRRVRFLYANNGLCRRLIDGLSRMVAGTGLVPHASTKDPVFNRAALAYWSAYANSRFSYDLGGRYNCSGSQYHCTRFQFRDGDYLQAQARTAAGDPANVFYEGHQCASGNFDSAGAYAGAEDDPGGLGFGLGGGSSYDGVIVGPHNSALGYRVRTADNGFVILPARDVIFGCDYDTAGQRRGLSIAHHAVNNMLDASEIQSFVKAGVKIANQYGHWIERGVAVAGAPTAGSRGGNKFEIPGAGGPITIERIMGPGVIPQLQPGDQVKFNTSAHPHPNQLGLIDYLIRDIAWGAGISPEIVWNVAALGGANTRFVLADAQSWINLKQQQLVDTKLSREWITVIGDALARKKLRAPRDPVSNEVIPQWWAHQWIPPARLTVDWGRDGKLQLEQIKLGALSFKNYFAWQGLDYLEQLDQSLDELQHIKQGLDARDLTWADWAALRATSGNGAANTAIAADPDLGDDPDAPQPDTADANDRLGALLKENPAKARAWLDQLIQKAA